MKFSRFVLLILIGAFLGCSKDKNNSSSDDQLDDPDEIVLLKRVLKDGVIYDEYQYDSEQRLTMARVHIGSNGIDYFLYTYDGETITTRGYDAMDFLLATSTLYPVNSQSYRFDYELSPPNRNYYIIVQYAPEGCGKDSQIQYYTEDDSLKASRYFEYEGVNCNDTEAYSDEYGTIASFVRTRDAFKNAYAGIFPQENFSYPAHNITSETRYNENGEISEQQSFTSTFVYNDMEYPLSEERTFLSGMVENYTYEYY